MPSVSYAVGMGVGNSGFVLKVKKELVQLFLWLLKGDQSPGTLVEK